MQYKPLCQTLAEIKKTEKCPEQKVQRIIPHIVFE